MVKYVFCFTKRDSEDLQFIKDSLLVKLNDEDPTVVSAVLELSEVRDSA